MRQKFIATTILLQNASGFLLHNATVLFEIVTVITKCVIYYKMCHLLQNVPVNFISFH